MNQAANNDDDDDDNTSGERAWASRSYTTGSSCAQREEFETKMRSTIRAAGRRRHEMDLRGGRCTSSRTDDEHEASGQLALSVDFAPATTCGSPGELERRGHLIELSLCVQLAGCGCGRGGDDEDDDDSTADHKHHRATSSGDDNHQAATARSSDNVRPAQLAVGPAPSGAVDATGKRRLVYERIDRFPLQVGGGDRPHLPELVLPFKSAAFDACFCFNLLSLRAAAELHESASHSDWLRAERRTGELRLALLAELRRVVKCKGKIMVTVFVYECQRREPANNARRQPAGKTSCGDADDEKSRARHTSSQLSSGSLQQQQQQQQHWDTNTNTNSSSGSQLGLAKDAERTFQVNDDDAAGLVDELEAQNYEDKCESCCPRCRMEEWTRQRSLQLQQHQHPARRRSSAGGGGARLQQPAERLATRAPEAVEDESRSCDTVQKLIERSQRQHAPDRCRPEHNKISLPANQDQPRANGMVAAQQQQQQQQRRYSALSLWRAMSGGGANECEPGDANFQLPDGDSISEAAKRLGRRLSLGGSSLLGRLFAPVTPSSQQQPAAAAAGLNLGGPRGVEGGATDATCDIAPELAGESWGAAQTGADSRTYPPATTTATATSNDVMNPMFDDVEFARRHRQSIAVQTFFTRSIKANDDDCADNDNDVVDIGGARRQLQAESIDERDVPSQQFGATQRASVDDNHLENNNNNNDDELTVNDSTTSGWTAPTSYGLESSALCSPPPLPPIDDDKLQRDVSELAAVGCLAGATMTSVERDDNKADGGSEQWMRRSRRDLERPTSMFDERSTRHQRSILGVSSVASGPSAGDHRQTTGAAAIESHLSAGGASSESGGFGGHLQQLDRINSDFSSFTLATSSTRSNKHDTTPTTGTSSGDGARGQRREQGLPLRTGAIGSEGCGGGGSSDGLSGMQHQQRRAFSETEAYEAAVKPANSCGDLGGGGGMSHNLAGAARPSALPANLICCGNPADIGKCALSASSGGLAPAPGTRLIKSAEQTRCYNSPQAASFATTTNTTATTSSSSNHHNQKQPHTRGFAHHRELHQRPLVGDAGNSNNNHQHHHHHNPAKTADQHLADNQQQQQQQQQAGAKASGYSVVAKHHQRQWCESNTFSSSLNSDISTSGQKDSTEKDSSRRTSTLSGISSIYQQEISLGLNTPGQSNLGGGSSTPSNSQAAQGCSNMGSIPELASVEPTNARTSSSDIEQPQGASSNQRQFRRNTDYAAPMRHLNMDSHQQQRQQRSSTDAVGPEKATRDQHSSHLLLTGSGRPEVEGANANGEYSREFTTDSTGANIQRVVQSLRSQLRERLSGMRQLNSFIPGLTSQQAADTCGDDAFMPATDFATTQLGERSSPSAVAAGNRHARQLSGQQAPTDRSVPRLTPTGHYQGQTSASSCDDQRQQQHAAEGRQSGNSPASLRSFFRSTSSAAFNAFASSFNQQTQPNLSSSSTPTGTTVRAFGPGYSGGHLSSNSSQLFGASGSVSSDVFDTPTTCGPSATSTPVPGSTKFNLFGFSGPSVANTDGTELPACNSPTITPAAAPSQAGGQGSLRSPISPISVTSTRFFARIRDKFSLSPSQQASPPSPRLAAAATPRAGSSPQPSTSPLGVKLPQTRASGKLESDQERESSNQSQCLPDTSKQQRGSNCEQEAGENELDESQETNERKVDRLHVADDDDDFYEDYERVVSSRRPSLQRQLDEQVNQVYREAVERKLQNSPIADHCDFGLLRQQEHPAPKFVGQNSGGNNNNNTRPHELNQTPTTTKRLLPSNSDLDSIIRPAAGPLLYNHMPHSIYLPAAPNPYYQQQPNSNQERGPAQQTLQQLWMESSQQSIDSSSSGARSLRSCWFSMPELYAMNRDSSSQSPSGAAAIGPFGGTMQQPAAESHLAGGSPMMDELLGTLATKLDLACDQRELDKQLDPAPGSLEWPSNQLYKQVAAGEGRDANWSLSDLNLTSDDIAAPKPLPALPNQQPHLQGAANNKPAVCQVELVKCSTLDDSVCVSMKTNSSRDCGIPAPTDKQVAAGASNSQQQQPDGSRPTSQNSTISSTSCALSDLSSGPELQPNPEMQLSRSASSSATGGGERQHELPWHELSEDASRSPLNNSPASLDGANQPLQDVDPLAPRCIVQQPEVGQVAASHDESASNFLSATPITVRQQRAMSMVPLGDSSNRPLDHGAAMSGGGLMPSSAQAPRRRSAMGNLLSNNPDMAPAAATLDLRLAARKNRVRLTDLHPITFMSDRKFLNSMSSLKKGNNKLDAIFNSPVGRRLSVNAETAAGPLASAGAQAGKSGIKIGLTGYVYLDQNASQQAHRQLPAAFRRPSLAPNFWRGQQAQQAGGDSPANKLDPASGLDGSHHQQHGSSLFLTPDSCALRRPRAASCTPNSLRSDFDAAPAPGRPVSGASSATLTISGTTDDSPAPTPFKIEPIMTKSVSTSATDRRRSTLSLLDRLSESSIELDTTSAEVATTCSSSSGAGGVLLAPSREKEQPEVVRHSHKALSLLQIGEDEELHGKGQVLECRSPTGRRAPPSPKIARPIGSSRGAHLSGTSPSGQATRVSSSQRRQQQHQQRRANSGTSSGDQSSSGGDEHDGSGDDDSSSGDSDGARSGSGSCTSSDDGDLDKLIAQYSVVGEPPRHRHQQQQASAARPPGFRSSPSGGGVSGPNRRHRSMSLCQSAALGHDDGVGERVVKNDMILRQLLLASLEPIGGAPSHKLGGHTSHERRPSAINLYQRDEDVFVANSMRRPPSSQIQVLNALPLLAGTLPVLHQHNSHRLSMQTSPATGAARAGVKSIISGTSGLRVAAIQTSITSTIPASANSQPGPQHGFLGNRTSLSATPATRSTSPASASTLAGEVDVEEQLNRLRQQERRLQALGCGGAGGTTIPASGSFAPTSSTHPQHHLHLFGGGAHLATTATSSTTDTSSPESRESLLSDKLELSDISIPNDLSAGIPAILQPPESLFQDQVLGECRSPNGNNQQGSCEQVVSCKLITTSTGCSIVTSSNRAGSPPHSPTTLAGSAPASPLGTLGAAAASQVYSSGSKSCEPFKQLDTIIEGRGLLLGAEQQANANYANRLRRLSGNHSRRSSLGTNNSQRDQTDDEWCKCDPSPAKRRSSSIVAQQQQPAAPGVPATAESAPVSQKVMAGGKTPAVATDASEQTASNEETSGGSGGLSSSSRFVLDTVRSLAKRTLNNLSTTTLLVSSSATTTTSAKSAPSQVQPIPQNSKPTARQQRSSSMVVTPSARNASRSAEWDGRSAALEQPRLPSSRLLERKMAEQKKRAGAPEVDGADSSSSETGSADKDDDDDEFHSTASSSSLNSLDDAENYRTKNKENKIKPGCLLASSSSASSLSPCNSTSGTKRKKAQVTGRRSKEAEERDDEDEDADADEEEDEEEDGDEEDEVDEPKICYKCNKKIRMEDASEYFMRQNCELDEEENTENFEDEEEFEDLDVEDEDENEEEEADDDDEEIDRRAAKSAKTSRTSPRSARTGETGSGRNGRPSQAGARSQRRNSSAGRRRTSSMNSASVGAQSAGANSGGPQQHCGQRRKNKWHIQRNLAPKLKRQRSFSANYAPEVPNPMMPPPRRFSAAPTLTCPHRNKSSPHSSSSLHHTYSIDSSESMITVIPANRGHEFKRTPRSSLSCNSGQDGASCGSFYALPRSPLSPRSPSRCSPSLLTPNTSEPPHGFPSSPTSSLRASVSGYALSKDSKCGSRTSMLADTLDEPRRKSTTCERQLNLPPPMERAHRDHSRSATELMPHGHHRRHQASGSGLKSPAATSDAEDGEEFCLFNVGSNKQTNWRRDTEHRDTGIDAGKPPAGVASEECFAGNNEQQGANEAELLVGNMCETINDFCARHSKEELEFLVKKLGYLRITDSYFSNKSSTLCMIIEVIAER